MRGNGSLLGGEAETSDPPEVLPTVPRMRAGQHPLCPRDAPKRRGLPGWYTYVPVLDLNRHVFGFGLLPLRDGHLQDAILELGGGVLCLDSRREGDGPRECPIVEFPVVVLRVFR